MAAEGERTGDDRSSESVADGLELISVVVPCRNEAAFIDDVLASIQAQTHTNLDVIVVDGESEDDTRRRVEARAAEDPRIRLLSNPERIVSPAMNRGLAAARGRWLVRVDAHCTIPPDYVARLHAHLRTERYSGVGGRKIGIGRTSTGRAIAAAMASPVGVGNSKYHHATEIQTVDHVPFGAYPVDLARSIGGWDPDVVVNQDFEFDQRIQATGRPLLLDPDIVIHWYCRQTVGDLFRQYRRYGRGKSVVARRHPRSVRPRHLVPPGFVLGVVALALPLGRLRTVARTVTWGRRLAGALYGSVLVAGAVSVESVDGPPLSRRERLRTISAFAAMHLGQGIGFIEGVITESAPDRHQAVIDLRTGDESVDPSTGESLGRTARDAQVLDGDLPMPHETSTSGREA